MENFLGMEKLLETCAQHLGVDINDANKSALVQRCKLISQQNEILKNKILETTPIHWEKIINDHKAHHHEWYNFISKEITLDEFAGFMLENKYWPTFLFMLEKILSCQFLPQSKKAIEENIKDEFQPEAHALLMKRLMEAIKKRASDSLELGLDSTLVDRTLIFYYGYFIEPWHLVGSLFATEHMGTHRVIAMQQGGERLGFTEHELAFTIVHSQCDEHHAENWLQEVIAPSIASRPELAPLIAAGIADCLETSAAYLDFLLHRVQVKEIN